MDNDSRELKIAREKLLLESGYVPSSLPTITEVLIRQSAFEMCLI